MNATSFPPLLCVSEFMHKTYYIFFDVYVFSQCSVVYEIKKILTE